MLHGSMFGWNTLGADPKQYERPEYAKLLSRAEKADPPEDRGTDAHGAERYNRPDIDIEPDAIQIFLDDLTRAKQDEIMKVLGDNGNYDVIPIAEIACLPEDDHSPPIRSLKESAAKVEASKSRTRERSNKAKEER